MRAETIRIDLKLHGVSKSDTRAGEQIAKILNLSLESAHEFRVRQDELQKDTNPFRGLPHAQMF